MRPGINSKERAQRIHIRKEVSVKPWQGQKDSNPHLTVLETVVLPLNYTSMMGDFSPDHIPLFRSPLICKSIVTHLLFNGNKKSSF